MRNSILVFLFLTLPFLSFGQGNRFSSLYFNNGKLCADSTLSISAEQFNIWSRAEPYIIEEIARNLTYPPVCLRNAVEGPVVVAFDFTGTELKNIRPVTISNSYFNEAATNTVRNSAKIIVKYLASREPSDNLKGIYYIPFDFVLLDLTKEIKKRGAIPIIKQNEPLLLRGVGIACPGE